SQIVCSLYWPDWARFEISTTKSVPRPDFDHQIILSARLPCVRDRSTEHALLAGALFLTFDYATDQITAFWVRSGLYYQSKLLLCNPDRDRDRTCSNHTGWSIGRGNVLQPNDTAQNARTTTLQHSYISHNHHRRSSTAKLQFPYIPSRTGRILTQTQSCVCSESA